MPKKRKSEAGQVVFFFQTQPLDVARSILDICVDTVVARTPKVDRVDRKPRKKKEGQPSLLDTGKLKITIMLLAFFLLPFAARAQTLTLQAGAGASSNLGTRPGATIEARAESGWLYSRASVRFQRKAYLDSGSIVTGDLLARWTGRSAWVGVGVEIARASTIAYDKTALRLLIGGGLRRPAWALGVFGFAPEGGTRNRSCGVRADLDLLPWRSEHRALVLTVRPYLLRYHNGPTWGRVYSGGGIEGLVGMRWAR